MCRPVVKYRNYTQAGVGGDAAFAKLFWKFVSAVKFLTSKLNDSWRS